MSIVCTKKSGIVFRSDKNGITRGAVVTKVKVTKKGVVIEAKFDDKNQNFDVIYIQKELPRVDVLKKAKKNSDKAKKPARVSDSSLGEDAKKAAKLAKAIDKAKNKKKSKKSKAPELIRIVTEDGELTFAPDHKVELASGGVVAVKKIRSGDALQHVVSDDGGVRHVRGSIVKTVESISAN